MIGVCVEEYDGFTRGGTSKYVHALHIGGRRWYVEFAASGVYVRMGGIDFNLGFGWADDA